MVSLADAICVVPGLCGLAYAAVEYVSIKSIKMVPKDGDEESMLDDDDEETDQHKIDRMKEIASFIQEGATAFLMAEYKYMAIYIVVFMVLFGGVAVAMGNMVDLGATGAFFVGALMSIVSGWIGMQTAVMCNVRTTYESYLSLPQGYLVAVRGGSIMGMALTSIGTLALYALVKVFELIYTDPSHRYEALAGYGLGGSSIALFGRVGGGIYTKAADVGADLSGKNEWGLDEDDPRNPACIADNVGDNVGDVAGMGSDLFGSFAEATCAAMVISGSSKVTTIATDFTSMMFPLMLSTTGILTAIITLQVCKFLPCFKIGNKAGPTVEKALKGILLVSTVLQQIVTILVAELLPGGTFSDGDATSFKVDASHTLNSKVCAICVSCGLWSGLVIGVVTEYYTSHSYAPVRQVAESQKTSAATGIIFGLALGYMSCIVPTVLIGASVCVSHLLAGMYGVALAALGMLGTLACCLTIDVYGPISDNAGGIAEMAGFEEDVRERTDCLDAAGNTTAAVPA
jgi:inorganic pyrophosphatase